MITLPLLPLSPSTILPTKAHPSDACFDVFAHSKTITDTYIEYGLGFATEIPHGRCALIYPRSSLSKTDLILANHVGVIDAGYRGERKMRFRVHKPMHAGADREPVLYEIGDKIGQFMLVPLQETTILIQDTLASSERGTGGFGSTGT
ncbi:MAG: hypothetical protein NZL83_02200 [Candidatus Absconditabacterales bacterium]|nr:hypothetical protein [Candidatus Absconditabacterales bacterium]